jgi:uncharacterized protein YciI
MTQYFAVFLRRGPAWTAEVTAETRKVSEGHMANIQRLSADGRLVVAGRFVYDIVPWVAPKSLAVGY